MSLGLVLSGGGIRCVAQLAVLKCLQDEGIKPSMFAGSSGGALVACLISAGIKPEQVMDRVKDLRLLSMVKLRFSRQGFIDIRGSLKIFTDLLPTYFEDLSIPVTVAATNLRTGCTEFFSKGPLHAPLLASCCMPVFFFPVSIGHDQYIDAGITNNFPADAISTKCNYLLGVHTNPINPDFCASSVRNILERTFLLAINGNVKANKLLCHQVLEPEVLQDIRVFDFKRAEEVWDSTLDWLQPRMPALKDQILKVV